MGTPWEVPEPRKINENAIRRRHHNGAAGRGQENGRQGTHLFFCPRPEQRPDLAPNRDMLTTLRIKNLALVTDLTLELQPGYNAITGETGAGKSILIGALNLALGERADRTLIRSGSDSCSVEAVFELTREMAGIEKFLEQNGLE